MRVHALLPAKEKFTDSQSGAVATLVHDFLRKSKSRDEAVVIGAPLDAPALGGLSYQPVKSWHRFLFGRNMGLARGYVAWLRSLPENEKPELIEVHGRCKVAGFIARACPEIPVALMLHNDPRMMDGARTASERAELADAVAAIISVSSYVEGCFQDGLPQQAIAKCQFHLARFGIDREFDSPPEKQKRILLVARMVPEKGVLEAARAAAAILPAFPDWQLQIIGARHFANGQRTGYETEVAEALAPLGEQAQMLGHLPLAEVNRYQAEAAIILVPSQWQEPAGRVVIEALVCGSALITTNRGGIPEYADGRAIILDKADETELATALRQLLDKPERLETWQRNAWDDYPFTHQAMTEAMDRIRQTILSGSTGRV